eukprot:TRINITY_DN1427_c0_g1_i3.p1 TRINITY_DN1427_c0_g1~~TRINITY_DN1427_c0_g1_i3.p1  ORF type:complete len:634 (-),score=150.70 TRINITY_DN1427_c0_g1_i3:88-1989(-)
MASLPPPAQLTITIDPTVSTISSFTAYTIQVSNSASSWTVIRRYRQFFALHRELNHVVKTVKLPPFPPKKWFGNTKPNFVATRRQALEAYLKEVVHRTDTSQCHFLRSFLDPKDKPAAVSLKSPQKEGSLRQKDAGFLVDKWKIHWVVLHDDSLYVFESSHALEPQATFKLTDHVFRMCPEKGQSSFEVAQEGILTMEDGSGSSLVSSSSSSSILSETSATTSKKSKANQAVVFRANTADAAEEWVKTLNDAKTMQGTMAEKTKEKSVSVRRSQSLDVTSLLSERKSMRPDSIRKMEQAHKKRTLIVQEIIATEESYVNSLSVLIRLFLVPLRETAQTNPIVNATTIKTIFSEIEVIFNVNRLLLSDLKSRMSNWSPSQIISDVFLQMLDFLKTYQAYVNNFNAALDCINKECETNSAFVTFIEKTYVNPECGAMTIQSFLIMPIQRIPRYVLLLEDLLKNTPQHHRDYTQLSTTQSKMKEIAIKLNEAKRDAENLTQVMNIQMRLVGKFENLVQPYRRYIAEAEVVEVGIKKGNPARILILFSDVLVVTKMKKGNKQHYRYRITLDIVTSTKECVDAAANNAPQLQVGVDNGQKWVWTFEDVNNRNEFLAALNQTIENSRNAQKSFMKLPAM